MITRIFLLASLVSGAAACSHAMAAPARTTSSMLDVALTRDSATAALASVPESGPDCRMVAIVASPIAAAHLEDPKIQQTAGKAQLVSYGSDGSERVLDGTGMATVVGKQPTGELLGNHHILFAEGSLRTQNDVIALTPTDDKCVFDAKVKMIFHDGSGEFAGLSGTGNAEAKLNFCGGVGRAVIYGRLCKAAAK
jgi:hypothetical protein